MLKRVGSLVFGPCWVPDGLYRALPLLCWLIGAFALLLPVGVVSFVCTTYLFCYGAWVLYQRAVHNVLARG
jgi:hypothetical protein